MELNYSVKSLWVHGTERYLPPSGQLRFKNKVVWRSQKKTSKTLLVLGGSGLIGSAITREGLCVKYNVKCLVRDLKNPGLVSLTTGYNLTSGSYPAEQDANIELAYGNLSYPFRLPRILCGVEVLINTAGSRSIDNNNQITDWQGCLAILEAAKLAKVKKFVFCSSLYADANSSATLLSRKARVENEIKKSGLNYIIYRCPSLFPPLLSDYAIPILSGQRVTANSQSSSTSYIDTRTLGELIVETIPNSSYCKTTLSIDSPEVWNDIEIIQVCERLWGKRAKITYVKPILTTLIARLLSLFSFTWSISERLEPRPAEYTNAPRDPSARRKTTLASSSTSQEHKIMSLPSPKGPSLYEYLQEYYVLLATTTLAAKSSDR